LDEALNPTYQVFRVEWFAEQCVRFEICHLSGIGGSNHHRNARKEYPAISGKRNAIYERHPNITQNKVNFSAAKYANSLQPVGGLKRPIARLFQGADHLASLNEVVLHNKYCAAGHDYRPLRGVSDGTPVRND
jgi:hypothetical protein